MLFRVWPLLKYPHSSSHLGVNTKSLLPPNWLLLGGITVKFGTLWVCISVSKDKWGTSLTRPPWCSNFSANWCIQGASLLECLHQFNKKTKVIRVCPVEDFPHLSLQTQIHAQHGPTFTEKPPSSSHLGGKCKIWDFYPQSECYPTYFDADIYSKCYISLFVRIN